MNTLQMMTQDFLQHCKFVKRLSVDTINAYSVDLKQFDQFVRDYEGEIDVSQIDRNLLRRYITELNTSFSPRSVNRKVACLKGIMRFLEEEEYIRENPFDKLNLRMKTPASLPETMSIEEVNTILNCVYQSNDAVGWANVSGDFIRLRDIAVLEMLFAAGVRVQELCSLKKVDLDVRQGFMRIKGKGGKERHVYIESQEVKAAIYRYMDTEEYRKSQCDYVFLNRFGNPMTTQAVRNIIKKYTKMAGIDKNITPHTFRHTFATLLLEEGVDIKYIQEFLGHSSISTTQIYLHVSSSKARKVLGESHPRNKIYTPED